MQQRRGGRREEGRDEGRRRRKKGRDEGRGRSEEEEELTDMEEFEIEREEKY